MSGFLEQRYLLHLEELMATAKERNELRDTLAALREQLASVQSKVEALTAERESVSSQLWDCMYERDGWKDRAERAERILAALREPSKAMLHEMTETWIATPWGANHWQAALRAAVTAAEQEVGDA